MNKFKGYCEYCFRYGNNKELMVTKTICKNCKKVHLNFYKILDKLEFNEHFKTMYKIWKNLK